VGLLAQRTRLCTTGGIRDVILWRRFDKLLGVLGLVAGALAANLALGQFRLGFAGQPLAHTDVIANFAAMAVAGLAAVLMGGCPLRQVVMAGEGDADAGGALAGMLAGALVAHGTGLASTPRGPAPGALLALAVAAALTAAGFLRRRVAPSAAVPSPQG
jgi:YedE family putative selenium metabolism protein